MSFASVKEIEDHNREVIKNINVPNCFGHDYVVESLQKDIRRLRSDLTRERNLNVQKHIECEKLKQSGRELEDKFFDLLEFVYGILKNENICLNDFDEKKLNAYFKEYVDLMGVWLPKKDRIK